MEQVARLLGHHEPPNHLFGITGNTKPSLDFSTELLSQRFHKARASFIIAMADYDANMLGGDRTETQNLTDGHGTFCSQAMTTKAFRFWGRHPSDSVQSTSTKVITTFTTTSSVLSSLFDVAWSRKDFSSCHPSRDVRLSALSRPSFDSFISAPSAKSQGKHRLRWVGSRQTSRSAQEALNINQRKNEQHHEATTASLTGSHSFPLLLCIWKLLMTLPS